MDESNNEENNEFDAWYTPESIAWKLYNDTFDEALSSNVLAFGPPGETDHTAYVFEMLLSVFLEMLFHMMALDSAKELEERIENGEDVDVDNSDLEPNFDYFDMDLYLPIIEKKFVRISHLARVFTLERIEDEFVGEIMRGRYCRIILRNNCEDTHYFDSIGSTDNYDFIPSEGFEPKKNLKDIYAILKLNDKIYKIYFDHIQKIGADIAEKMF